jgi:septum formation topological specificity factor MinE
VIATNWSGHLDFLNGNETVLLPGLLKNVPKSMVWKDIIIEESKWFNVDENAAYKAFNYVFDNIKEAKDKAKLLMDKNRNKFTLNKMCDELDNIVEKYTSNISSEVKINLPKLKKASEVTI